MTIFFPTPGLSNAAVAVAAAKRNRHDKDTSCGVLRLAPLTGYDVWLSELIFASEQLNWWLDVETITELSPSSQRNARRVLAWFVRESMAFGDVREQKWHGRVLALVTAQRRACGLLRGA